jgi:transaldolase
MYVVDLVAPDTVNTMPEGTIEATADHGEITGDTVTTNYDDVTAVLEREGVEKFSVSWGELLDTVRVALEAAR